jgi:predicted RNA binding protein YcfA (HicA-like mRNA interferase family)
MPKLPRVTPRKVIQVLLRLGFFVHHQTGSHVNLRHSVNELLHVVVPYHNRDLAPKTLKSILAQAGINLAEFLREL